MVLGLGPVAIADSDDGVRGRNHDTNDVVITTTLRMPTTSSVSPEVPQNQQVPIERATFDRGGYQLYDTVGEVILIPFTNDNLYVMKFSQTSSDQMSFVNDRGTPTLYVPSGGYLENASVPGGKWYPFPENFPSNDPVYLGIAPSWDSYLNMGWYPDMSCYGGYYCDTSYPDGGDFEPTLNLCFDIGGTRFFGWNAFHRYCLWHPPWRHMGLATGTSSTVAIVLKQVGRSPVQLVELAVSMEAIGSSTKERAAATAVLESGTDGRSMEHEALQMVRGTSGRMFRHSTAPKPSGEGASRSTDHRFRGAFGSMGTEGSLGVGTFRPPGFGNTGSGGSRTFSGGRLRRFPWRRRWQ